MKLTSLKAFVAAIEEGSLRRAAARIGVSQPALTKMVRELEVELSATLLVRTSRGVIPTAQGKVLHARAQAVGRELSAAADEINQLGGKMVGEIAIGAVPLAVMLLMPETLRTFGKAFPDIRLNVSEELYIAQLQRLRKGEVDIAVGGIPDGLATGEFMVEPLMTTTMVVVARKGSPFARATSLQQIACEKWVYTGTTAELGYAKALFEANGMAAPPVGAIVNSTLALLSIVATGDILGLMPRQIAMHPMAAEYISIVPVVEVGLDLQVGAIVRSDSVLSPAIRHLITHLHRAAHQVAVNT
jgi:LysR family transcriptional regulator, regulator of abg operon